MSICGIDMLNHAITIETFNMQKNVLPFKTLFLYIYGECNHKHTEIILKKIQLKNILKNTYFSTSIAYAQAKCNDLK